MERNSTILIVEDSDTDFDISIRAFKKTGIINKIFRCTDGDDALDYLYRRGEYKGNNEPLPNVILLDLNLPGTDGREVLETIKADDNLKSIPVIVLTTSSDERDIEQCYRYGANSYILKPVNFESYIEAIQRLKDFWFEVVVIPGDER
ncbi:MAG: two-component system response regulator [SAR86 cluster bacterium]|uniref:Two-component system response regulator n=1 Tax=SAR86 cluster bacterium TaxID=2030880 RepID=A0A2A4MJ11_9GAMM|nr:MAG: two-component system response regulator [SAR86 cluster bacterium]